MKRRRSRFLTASDQKALRQALDIIGFGPLIGPVVQDAARVRVKGVGWPNCPEFADESSEKL